MDYGMVNDVQLVFPSGSVSGTTIDAAVTITNDDVFEKDENFFVNISSEMNVMIHNFTETVIIIDEDSKHWVGDEYNILD